MPDVTVKYTIQVKDEKGWRDCVGNVTPNTELSLWMSYCGVDNINHLRLVKVTTTKEVEPV